MSLAIVAACTPDDVEVDIVDENYEDIDFDDPVDLVGITTFTYQAKRAYEIADEHKKRGAAVVMGEYMHLFGQRRFFNTQMRWL